MNLLKNHFSENKHASRIVTYFLVYHVFQKDLSDLDLETLAPYIPMDGEDFQLNPIISESKSMEDAQAGSRVGGASLDTQQSFSNIASLFQPLSSPPPPPNHYQTQPQASWATGERRSSGQGAVEGRGRAYMMGQVQTPPYQAPASAPLSSLQWPPDPLITYQQQRQPPAKTYLMDNLSGEERPSCQQNMSHLMQKQR